jgi:hypothetical protein
MRINRLGVLRSRDGTKHQDRALPLGYCRRQRFKVKTRERLAIPIRSCFKLAGQLASQRTQQPVQSLYVAGPKLVAGSVCLIDRVAFPIPKNLRRAPVGIDVQSFNGFRPLGKLQLFSQRTD